MSKLDNCSHRRKALQIHSLLVRATLSLMNFEFFEQLLLQSNLVSLQSLSRVAAFIAITLASRGIIAVAPATCGINAVIFRGLQIHHDRTRESRYHCDCSCKSRHHRARSRESRHLCDRCCELPGIIAIAFASRSIHRNRICESWYHCNRIRDSRHSL